MNFFNIFKKKKEIENRDYTMLHMQLAEASASGESILKYSAAVEAAAGLFGRCFMMAKTNEPRLTPSVLSDIGRSLIKHGESLHYIGNDELVPIVSYNFDDENKNDEIPYRKNVRYRCQFSGPNKTVTTKDSLGIDSVLHVKYSSQYQRPFIGAGPIYSSGNSGCLAESVERSLTEDMQAETAQVIPVMIEEENQVKNLNAQIKAKKGRTLLVQTQPDLGGEGQKKKEWEQKRLGPNPPEHLVKLYESSQDSIFKACGIPLALMSEGVGQREGLRHFIVTAIQPLGKLVEEYWLLSTGQKLELDFKELTQTDLAARARAYKAFIDSGMTPDQAQSASGIMET